jgi:MOSC domain-containing protein YiiM
MIRRLNLDGDRQADLSVHGGPAKAVYVYPSEHYPFWRHELAEPDLPWGAFGENLTTEGWREEDSCIGDQFRIGDAVVMVTQPRTPCYKLAVKFGRDDIIERFLESGRPGFYLSVVIEGAMKPGDSVDRVHQDENGVTVADINSLFANEKANIPLMRRALHVEALPRGWRNHFLRELASNGEAAEPPSSDHPNLKFKSSRTD